MFGAGVDLEVRSLNLGQHNDSQQETRRDVTERTVGCGLGCGGGILRLRAAVTSLGVAGSGSSRPIPTIFGSVNGSPSSIWLESFGKSVSEECSKSAIFLQK